MSWSVGYKNREDFEKDVREHEAALNSSEAVEQLNVGRLAAKAIMESGAVGVKDGDYRVSLNGHANPEHRPATGWANDCIGVNVSQKTS